MIIVSRIMIFWLFTMAALLDSSAQTPSDEQHELKLINEYLNERNLDRLSIRLAEMQLASELDAEKRRILADLLADRYREHFFANMSADQTGQFVSRAERLVKNYPEIETPKLRLAISHAKYLDSEQEFLSWWQSGAPAENSDTIRSAFREVFLTLQKQIEFDQQLQQKTIAVLPYDETESLSRQKQLNEIETRLVHAHYLSAWTSYFLAVTSYENDKQKLTQAQSDFYRTLHIEQDKPIDQIDSKWLDFASPLSHRSLLGLAMVYSAQGKSASARFCFRKADELGGNYFEPAIWRFNSLAFSKRWNEAIRFVKQVDHSTLNPNFLKSFWEAVTHAGYSADARGAQAAIQLKQFGLLGLLREFDATTIRRFVEQDRIQLSDKTAVNLWIKGLLNYHAADNKPADNNREKLVEARLNLRAAVELAPNEFDEIDGARIRYLLGHVEFDLGNIPAAVQQLEKMPVGLRVHDLKFAEKVAWLNCRAMIRLSKQDYRQKGRALAALNDFLATYPASRFSNRIAFERVKLSNSLLPPEEAIKILRTIKPTSENFGESQFEIVKNQHRIWESNFRTDKSGEPKVFEQLVQLDQQYRSLANLSPAQKVSSLLYVIDASLRRNLNESTIARIFEATDRIAGEAVDDQESFQSQLIYYKFMAARKFGNIDSAKTLASWLFDHAQSQIYQVAALAFLAKTAEESSETSTVELITIYEALTNRLGTDQNGLLASKNARVAAGRLVELYVESHQLDLARNLNQILLKAKPNHERYLLNRARIETQSGNLNEALAVWRKLSRASKAGSDLWLESKLGVISCLSDEDPKLAQQILRQTVSLAGELTEPWKTRLRDAGEKFGGLGKTTILHDQGSSNR